MSEEKDIPFQPIKIDMSCIFFKENNNKPTKKRNLKPKSKGKNRK